MVDAARNAGKPLWTRCRDWRSAFNHLRSIRLGIERSRRRAASRCFVRSAALGPDQALVRLGAGAPRPVTEIDEGKALSLCILDPTAPMIAADRPDGKRRLAGRSDAGMSGTERKLVFDLPGRILAPPDNVPRRHNATFNLGELTIKRPRLYVDTRAQAPRCPTQLNRANTSCTTK